MALGPRRGFQTYRSGLDVVCLKETSMNDEEHDHHHFIFAATPSTFVFPSNLSDPFKFLGRLVSAEETQTVLYFHAIAGSD